jgi:hypothetical protein
MAHASLVVNWDRVLADAAFDGENHHAYAREGLGIRSSVIPLNPRGRAGKPGGKYRRPMSRRFAPEAQRLPLPAGVRPAVAGRVGFLPAQAPTRERSDASRERECQLRVLTHKLMLLAAHGLLVSREHPSL